MDGTNDGFKPSSSSQQQYLSWKERILIFYAFRAIFMAFVAHLLANGGLMIVITVVLLMMVI